MSNSAEALGQLLQRAAQDEGPTARLRAFIVGLASGAASRREAARSAATVSGGVVAGVAHAAAAVGRRLLAQLVVGSGGEGSLAPAFGVRGLAGARVQRLYHAEQCEIDLRVAAHGETWQIAGQLFGVETAQQVLLSGPAFEASVALDATQEFRFAGLTAGSYALTVTAGELAIVVRGIEAGPAGGA